MSISIPIFVDIKNGCLGRCDSIKESIDSFIELLLSTPCNGCVADPYFGFIFINLKFEIFNENDGVVNIDNKEQLESIAEKALYEKKISGSSKNLNTFASELKTVIERYEKRLSDVAVSMLYVRDQKSVFVTIKGIIEQTKVEYQYSTIINVWS